MLAAFRCSPNREPLIEQKLAAADDDGEGIVDLVRDACRQLADGGKLGRLHEALLRPAQSLHPRALVLVEARVPEGDNVQAASISSRAHQLIDGRVVERANARELRASKGWPRGVLAPP